MNMRLFQRKTSGSLLIGNSRSRCASLNSTFISIMMAFFPYREPINYSTSNDTIMVTFLDVTVKTNTYHVTALSPR